jgi:hypothetical protein
MGGSGVLGPVADWGTQYWESESVTVATPGQVSLIAREPDYSRWVKHVIVSHAGGIPPCNQGFMPADINQDGLSDLVAHVADKVMWYANTGDYEFVPLVIGEAEADESGCGNLCIQPCDVDQDGDLDVLVATLELGWYENQALSWVYHPIDTTRRYVRVVDTDVELDGDVDIITIGTGFPTGLGLVLFRNEGSEDFVQEIIKEFNGIQGWRTGVADFNRDGYPDIYCSHYDVFIFLNDSTGHFTESWSANYWDEEDFDGTSAVDIDMDGDMDLVCGNHYNSPYGFYALLNEESGSNFICSLLVEEPSNSYMDGSITRDIDLDGFPDIAGTLQRVGWFRHNPANPLTFILYDIDATNNSHWIYAATMGGRCTPSIDLFVTCDGAHILYENRMLSSFVREGWLISSILELSPVEPCSLWYFGYNACIPADSTLGFCWRVGTDSADIVDNPWSGPHYVGAGINVVDSFALGGGGMMFQYKVVFRSAEADIPVLYEVWLTYGFPGVEESEVLSSELDIQIVGKKIWIYLPVSGDVSFKIYDICGRIVKSLCDGYLMSGRYEFTVPERRGLYFIKACSPWEERVIKFVKIK